jgi:hypothetical protein
MTKTLVESVIADIEAEMEGRQRGFADVRGELLFRCSDALTTLASRIEELERALGLMVDAYGSWRAMTGKQEHAIETARQALSDKG